MMIQKEMVDIKIMCSSFQVGLDALNSAGIPIEGHSILLQQVGV